MTKLGRDLGPVALGTSWWYFDGLSTTTKLDFQPHKTKIQGVHHLRAIDALVEILHMKCSVSEVDSEPTFLFFCEKALSSCALACREWQIVLLSKKVQQSFILKHLRASCLEFDTQGTPSLQLYARSWTLQQACNIADPSS